MSLKKPIGSLSSNPILRKTDLAQSTGTAARHKANFNPGSMVNPVRMSGASAATPAIDGLG